MRPEGAMLFGPSGLDIDASSWILSRATPSSRRRTSRNTLLARRVELEQRLEAADSTRLDVEGPRLERRRVKVGDRCDERVVGDAVEVRPEELGHFGQVVRILDDRVRKRLEDAVVARDNAGMSSISMP